MAGVFKTLDRSDVRITPFRAYKAFSGVTSYTTYSAILSTTPIELGNDAIDSDPTLYNANGYLKDSVWRTTNHLFYKHHYDNTKASFGPIDLINQQKLLYPNAFVISLPQTNIGEGLAPNTLEISINNKIITNDIYNNLVYQNDSTRWGNAEPLTASNVVFSLKEARFSSDLNKTLTGTYDYFTDLYSGQVALTGVVPTSASNFELKLANYNDPSSSIQIKPYSPDTKKKFNFTNQDYTISFLIKSIRPGLQNQTIFEKGVTTEILGVDQNGELLKQTRSQWPYRLTLLSATQQLAFSKKGTAGSLDYTTSFTVAPNDVVYLTRLDSDFTIGVAGGASETFTDTLYNYDDSCSNTGNIYILNGETGTSGSSMGLDRFTFYDRSYESQFFDRLVPSTGYMRGNPYKVLGNVFPSHGLIAITDPLLQSELTNNTTTISSLKYRGTTTIFETEVSCTIGPNEFNYSNNPSLLRYDGVRAEYVLQDFATGSAFRPFISQIGLYNDSGELLVAGKLSQPIQLPRNVDTTIIVRYDR